MNNTQNQATVQDVINDYDNWIEKNPWNSTKEMRSAYRDAEKLARFNLQNALERENNLTNYSKRQELFDMAYDDNHSYGYNSVVERYRNLAELIDDQVQTNLDKAVSWLVFARAYIVQTEGGKLTTARINLFLNHIGYDEFGEKK